MPSCRERSNDVGCWGGKTTTQLPHHNLTAFSPRRCALCAVLTTTFSNLTNVYKASQILQRTRIVLQMERLLWPEARRALYDEARAASDSPCRIRNQLLRYCYGYR